MKTSNMQGAFEFQLNWTPQPADTSDVAAGPTIFDSLEREVGVKLEARKHVMPIIVTDRADKLIDAK